MIEHVDPDVSTPHLTIGRQFDSMSDRAILDLFNAVIDAQETLAAEYDHTLIEVPLGKPQISYHEDCDQWVPCGDVLRCHIEEDESGEPIVWIDDQELSLRDFGRLLKTHAGWGMRVLFVPDDRTEVDPEIEIREPEEVEE